MTLPQPDHTPDPTLTSFAPDTPPPASWQDKVKPSGPKTFADRVRKSAGSIYLVRGNDRQGRAAWYYLQVRPTHRRKFEKDIKTGRLNLGDYGTILNSGFGTDPPESIQQQMREQYGFAS